MHCANPNCHAAADDISTGTLKLIEYETAPEDRILNAAGGFPVCSASSRFFWLCPACSRSFTIRKWNSSGVGLEALPGIASPKVSAMSGKPASMATPDSEITPEELYRGAGTRQSFGHAGPYPRHTSSPVKKL